ncbi:tRNA 5-methylaminomethyl-2-thiouridine biosynthesis bifunctional protein [Acinetobacter marinus]|uniref:tRNA 5-methylaminomethyl-2-thiouridine biosynthesis bifunctional protein MnmC n=1 Tax=Acinetobacter marinus TaxID=281375 RepID=A0A1G6HPX9_9GAMM|nr:FAD-dependent 5-carboxymethylaminomethyl-2-thiouridine(34) oxidoreductase MnmC [Acinetobacter marinus]SDB96292.1 tRNA 5-methylaminomethyl-2-thiouridine biosynthesis bifunctional protein [Acinetobacter marinus]
MNHSPNISPISCAELDWQQVDGVDIPVSKQFGDVYFSKANGLLETRHVFLNGNDLSERLAQLADGEQFVVGETGLGTGLNFLALWQLWQNVRPNNNSRLHFISVEKYPLSQADLARALSTWDELAPLSKRLIESYPFALAGCHRIRFDDERISLDVWFGDASECFPLMQSHRPVNAWFLDGFAPSCNPELWQEQIFQHIMRLSAQGTTFASFSVAGVLKRALQSYGVEITRPKGFGHKREMLKAVWKKTDDQIQNDSQYNNHSTQRKVAIIGAGIAGLTTAWTLAQRDIAVTLFEQDQPLAGGSGNPLAMLNPKLCSMDKVATHLMTTSWQYALRFYPQFDAFQAMQIEQIHDTKNHEKKINEVLSLQDYPKDILALTQHDAEQSTILLKQAGVLSPHQFAKQVLVHPLISLIQKKITQLEVCDDQQIRLYNQDDNKAEEFSDVIVCNAMDLNRLFPNTPKLKPIRGQVTWTNFDETDFNATDINRADLKTPLENSKKNTAYSFGGYASPMQDNQTPQLIFGASFLPTDDQTNLRIEDHQHNFQLLQQYQPELAERISDNPKDWQGRAALRAQTADYLPLIGRSERISPNIYLFAGLGSKGFLFAPLCAELIVSQMLNDTLPVPSNLAYLLRPDRFKIKPKNQS